MVNVRFKFVKCAVRLIGFAGGFACFTLSGAAALRSATLLWNPVNEPDVVGYRLHCGTASHVYTRTISAGQPAATVPDLVEGKTYFFAVTSINRQGLESLPSSELSFVVPPAPNGVYSGLFFEDDGVRQESAGAFVLTATTRGFYSGRLLTGAGSGAFSGRLDAQSQGTNVVRFRNGGSLAVEFSLGDGAQAGKISGRVANGNWSSALTGNCAVFNGRSSVAPYAAAYTLVVPGSDADSTVPMGDGYGTVTVGANGLARLGGVLADGTKVSQSASVSRDGLWPLYVGFRSGQGMVLGWLAFTNREASDLSGTIGWIRQPDARARFYSAGFSREFDVVGSKFVRPSKGSKRVLSFTSGNASFSGGNLGAGFADPFTIDSAGRAVSPDGSGFTASFSTSQGIFRGRTADPATGRAMTFSGVVLQKPDVGRGFLSGTNQSSRVTLGP